MVAACGCDRRWARPDLAPGSAGLQTNQVETCRKRANSEIGAPSPKSNRKKCQMCSTEIGHAPTPGSEHRQGGSGCHFAALAPRWFKRIEYRPVLAVINRVR